VLDLNATVDRLRAGTSGNRFETVDFRSEGGGDGSAAVNSSSDALQTSSSAAPRGGRDDVDDDEEDDITAAIERAQLNNDNGDSQQPTLPSAWDNMSESSPC